MNHYKNLATILFRAFGRIEHCVCILVLALQLTYLLLLRFRNVLHSRYAPRISLHNFGPVPYLSQQAIGWVCSEGFRLASTKG